MVEDTPPVMHYCVTVPPAEIAGQALFIEWGSGFDQSTCVIQRPSAPEGLHINSPGQRPGLKERMRPKVQAQPESVHRHSMHRKDDLRSR